MENLHLRNLTNRFPKNDGPAGKCVFSGFKFALMLGIYVKFQGATLLPYSYSMTSGDSYC